MRRAITATIGALALFATALPPVAALAQEASPTEDEFSVAGHAEWLSTDPDDDTQEELVQGPFAGLLGHLQHLVSSVVATPTFAAPAFTVPSVTNITVISTGVDLEVLGSAAGRVEVVSRGGADGQDAIGWGTWATSVLLQAAPASSLTVIDVYRDALPNEAALARALEEIDPESTDAVLLAFPPGDVLDPTSRLLASGRAGDVLDAALDTIVTLPDGNRVVGIPTDADARNAAQYVGGWSDLRDVRNAARAITNWEDTVVAVAALVAAGVPVVAPAGDLGPTPQSVLGLAGLADVIAVGAADAAGAVTATSARGPSMHGTAKPDVVAPVVFAGVLPTEAALPDLLDANDLLDGALPVSLAGTVGSNRTASASTIPAATQVAAAVAALHAAGVSDLARVRGELMAAAVPTASRDVLAEGAGVLALLPTPEMVGARPTVVGPLDLGMEPDDADGDWSASVAVLGGIPGVPAVELDRWVGMDGTGRRSSTIVDEDDRPQVQSFVGSGTRASIPGDDAPEGSSPSVSLHDGRLGVWLAPGEHTWSPGVFCGYSRVTLIGTSSDVDTSADVGTGPVIVPEDVPTCLVEGMRLDVLNFYIHDVPAQDFTLALLPNLPVGMGLLEGPTMVLPVHPTKERIYSKVSGPDGYVTFGAVVPGFYRMRQFSDYSVDVAEDHPGGTINRDLGNPLTYSQKDALVLPDLVCQVPREERSATPDACHLEQLEPLDADGEVGYDKTTGRYLVDLPELGEQGVVLGWAKKMQLTVVSSRYIDVMGGADWTTDSPRRTAQDVVRLLADLSQIDELEDLAGPLAAQADALVDDAAGTVGATLGLTDLWRWTGPPGPGDPLVAQYSGLSRSSDPSKVIGMADYPFAMTTPNYKGSLDWNFTYDLDEVAMIAVVEVGRERHVAVFTPAGVMTLSPLGTEQPIDPVGLLEVHQADGVAHLAFTTHPKGAKEGLLTLLAVPLDPRDPATLRLADMSMEVTTWQRVEWPPIKHLRDGVEVGGHQFEVQPRYADFPQMQDGRCRAVSADLTGGHAGQVCEEWNIITHSGKYDVETFRILDGTDGSDVTSEVAPAGGMFHDPQHGVTDATLALAHDVRLAPLASADLSVLRELRSNGEFFELLHLPTAVVREHPDSLVFQLQDNIVGRQATTIATHRNGAVPLSGYLRFAPRHDEGVAQPPTIPAFQASARSDTPGSGPGASRPAGASSFRSSSGGIGGWAGFAASSSDTDSAAQAIADSIAFERDRDGVSALTQPWDIEKAAQDHADAMADEGRLLPGGADVNWWCDLDSLVLSVDADGDVVRAVEVALDDALASGQRASVVAPDADHLGVGVTLDRTSRAWISVLVRKWDGTALPPEPVVTTPTTGGGGGGGGGTAGGGGGGGGGAVATPATTGPAGSSAATGTSDHAGSSPPEEREQASPAPAPAPAPAASAPKPAPAPGPDQVVRHEGSTRMATAAAIARATFASADVVVIASASGFADALAGAPIAASHDAPLLLNPVDVGRSRDGQGLDPAVVGELSRLRPATVILLGGTSVLSDDVATHVRTLVGATVVRLSGSDRFSTAVRVAEALGRRHEVRHAYLVEGRLAWADAVSAAAVAGWRHSPILLTEGARLPEATAAHLRQSGITEVTVVGGSAVVHERVLDEVRRLGIRVERLRGADRYATSAAVATHGQALGMSRSAVWMATGRSHPDALAAAAAAASEGAVVLLVDGRDPAGGAAARAWLSDRAEDLRRLVVAGGRGAVSDAVLADLSRAAA